MSDTIEILRGLRDPYEAHHQVRFTDEALVAAAELSDRYITDRFLPDKAIDLIDQAGARVRLKTKTPPRDRREADNKLSSMLLDGRLLPGQHVTVSAADDALTFQVTDRDPAQIPPQARQSSQGTSARKG